jgi:hypothetical protein
LETMKAVARVKRVRSDVDIIDLTNEDWKIYIYIVSPHIHAGSAWLNSGWNHCHLCPIRSRRLLSHTIPPIILLPRCKWVWSSARKNDCTYQAIWVWHWTIECSQYLQWELTQLLCSCSCSQSVNVQGPAKRTSSQIRQLNHSNYY